MKYFQNSYDLDDEREHVGNLSAALGAAVACLSAFVLAWNLSNARPASEIASGWFAVALLFGLVSALLGAQWWEARKAFIAQKTRALSGSHGVSVSSQTKKTPLF